MHEVVNNEGGGVMTATVRMCIRAPFSSQIHPARFCRNPLMLPQTLDEQRRDGELYETGMETLCPRLRKRRCLYRIAQVKDHSDEGHQETRDRNLFADRAF